MNSRKSLNRRKKGWFDSQPFLRIHFVYLIACIAMVFTGISYYHFSKKFPMAGSVYSYITRGVNPFVGFIAGWLILLDYFFIPALVYKSGGIYMSELVGCLIMVLALAIHFLGTGGGYGGLAIEPFYQEGKITLGFIATACAIACLSFLGFDGISTLAEETRNPEKTIGKAVIAAIVCAGLIFIIQTYFYELCWGGKDPSVFDDAMGFFQVFGEFVGDWLVSFVMAVMMVAIFENVLTAQASAARIIFGMGRDRNLPHILSTVSPKRQVPFAATILLGIASAILLFIPYQTLVLLVNLGALVSFVALDLAVIWHFFIKGKKRTSLKHWIIYLCCPVIGAAILLFVLCGFSKVTYIVFACWLIAGIIILGIRTKGFKIAPGTIEM